MNEVDKLKRTFKVIFATICIAMISVPFLVSSKETYENVCSSTWFLFMIFIGIITFKNREIFVNGYEYIYANFPELYKRLFGIVKPKGIAGTTTYKIVWLESRYIKSTKDQKLIDILNIHRWLLIGSFITFASFVGLIILGTIVFSTLK